MPKYNEIMLAVEQRQLAEYMPEALKSNTLNVADIKDFISITEDISKTSIKPATEYDIPNSSSGQAVCSLSKEESRNALQFCRNYLDKEIATYRGTPWGDNMKNLRDRIRPLIALTFDVGLPRASADGFRGGTAGARRVSTARPMGPGKDKSVEQDFSQSVSPKSAQPVYVSPTRTTWNTHWHNDHSRGKPSGRSR